MALQKNNANSSDSVIKLLLILAYADGNYSLNERKFIQNICKKIKFSQKQYNYFKKEILKQKKNMVSICKTHIAKIKTKSLRNKTLTLLVELAAEDHILHEDEMMLLALIAEEWGMYKRS